MSENQQEPDRYRAERLAARAAKYHAEVARLRALLTDDAHQPTTEQGACP